MTTIYAGYAEQQDRCSTAPANKYGANDDALTPQSIQDRHN